MGNEEELNGGKFAFNLLRILVVLAMTLLALLVVSGLAFSNRITTGGDILLRFIALITPVILIFQVKYIKLQILGSVIIGVYILFFFIKAYVIN